MQLANRYAGFNTISRKKAWKNITSWRVVPIAIPRLRLPKSIARRF